MTEVTLRITADARRAVDGINQVDRALDGLSDSAPGAARAVNQVGDSAQRAGREAADGFGGAANAVAGLRAQVLGLVAGAATIGTVLSVAGIADEYAAVSARLKNAVGDSMSLAAAQDAVFEVAQRTRSSLAATGDLVSGLARAYKAAGMDAEQAFGTSLRLSEAINNAITASGTSAATASGMITQLNQALSSGVLRGDEFNSMMEASPRLAQALAAGLNVPIGRLREMAEAGQLTRDRVTAALTGVEWDKLAAEAAAMPLSLAQGWQQVTNAFQQYVGRANSELGATTALAEALGLVGRNIGILIDGALRLGTALAAGFGIASLLPVLAAFQAQLTAAGSAALGTATAMTAVNVAMTGMLAAGLALVAGWQVGAFFRDNFVEARLAGIAFVEGTLVAFERLREGVQVVWEGIKAAGSGALNFIREELALMLEGIAGLADVEVFGTKLLGETAAGMKDFAAMLRPTTSAADDLAAAVLRINDEAEDNIANVKKITGELADYEIAQELAAGTTQKTTAALGAQAPAATAAADAAGKLAEAQREAAESTRMHAEAMGELRDAGSQYQQLSDRIADAMAAPAERARREYERMIAVIDRYEAALPNLGAVDPAELARVQQLRADVERVYQASIDGSKEAAEANKRAAEESQRYWGGFGDAISNTLGDGLVNGFKGTADQLKNIFKRLLADLATAAISQRIVIPIMTALGLPTGGMQSGGLLQTILGGGQGGNGGLLSSLFGGGGSGSGGFLGQIGSTVGGAVRGVLGSVFGIGGGTLGAIGAAGAATGIGLGAAGTAAGATGLGLAGLGGGAAGAGAFAGATAGGAAGLGIMGALSSIASVAGPIALAAIAINALAGGRLFGTSYKTDRAGMQLDIGENGASGYTFEEQSRRRALFRGTRRRTVQGELPDEAQQSIDNLFTSVGQTVAAAAGALGIEVPDMISASFRRTVDGKGNVIGEVGTILGRTYNESFERFSQRIAAENVIATIDRALGGTADAVADSIGEAAAEGVEGGAAQAAGLGDEIGEGIGTMLKGATTAVQGEASRIAERWRSDAELLADGAGMLLAAATDIRRGAGLLGDGSLTQIADLIGELQVEGESLVQTYARVSGATQLLEQALDLSGLTLNKTREEFVRFATGIADAAGGLDRAAQLWNNYFNTFFTAEERAVLAQQRARANADREFADIGLDVDDFTGPSGLAEFRRRFDEILKTGSAEAIVQWLEAGEALGFLSEATRQLGDTAITSAENIRDFMAGIDAELAGNAAPLGLDEQLEQQRKRNAEMVARAQELGASEDELARVRRLGQQRINAIIQSVAPQTQTLLSSLRMLGIAATGTAEDIAVAASGLSGDFGGLLEGFLGSFYTEAERGAMRQTVAQGNLNSALQAAGLSTDNIISRTELRIRIEQALADGNYKLAESLLRVARAMDQVDAAAGNAANSVGQQVDEYGRPIGGSSFIGGGGGFDSSVVSTGSNPFQGSGLADEIERIRTGLRDWLTALTTGDLSPERPRDRLRRAQAEFDRLYALAQAGDADAMRQLQQAGENVLRLGRQVFASGQGYTDLYNAIIGRVGAIAGGGPAGISPVDGVGRLGSAADDAAEALRRLAGQLGLPSAGLLSDFGSQVATSTVDGILSQIRATQPPPAQQQQQSNAPVVAAIDRAGAATVQRLAELTRRVEQLETVTADAARQQIRAVDRQTDVMKATR